MNLLVKTSLHFNELKKQAHRASVDRLVKAASYVRTTIKRSIRYRKNKESSPGRPPFDHGTFRKSVRFSVDRANLTAYIGPSRLLRAKANPDGKSVPETLEFGGTARVGMKRWFVKNPPEMNSLSELAAYFHKVGYGPMFMANTPSGVMDQAADYMHWKRPPKYQGNIRQRQNKLGQHKFYLSLPLKSQKMAARAARLVAQNFGMPKKQVINVAARPYLAPGLEKAKSSLAAFFKNSL